MTLATVEGALDEQIVEGVAELEERRTTSMSPFSEMAMHVFVETLPTVSVGVVETERSTRVPIEILGVSKWIEIT